MNPYWGTDLFQFFPLFFSRMGQLITGKLPLDELASDEIQVLVLALVAVASVLVGTLLLLKRMTMLANSLSHTILLGIVLAYLIFSGGGGQEMNFRILFIAAVIAGILTSLFTQLLHQGIKLQEDASIGIVFTTLFALGILLVTLYTRNTHIGLEVVMGNADALHFHDLKIVGGVALGSFLLVALFFKEWRLVCFDSGLANALGFSPSFFNYLLMLMTSCTAISAFRAVGVLLFLAYLVGLPLIARLITHNLRGIFLFGTAFGLLIALLSVALARHLLTVHQMPLSTAGISVTLIGICFLLVLGSTLTFSGNQR